MSASPGRPRILYVNQTAQVSGAEHSLLTLLAGIREQVDPTVACPPGDLTTRLQEAGIPTKTLRGTELSFRLHPHHTTHGLVRVARDVWRLARIAHNVRPDILHANTLRAGLIATPVGLATRRPVAVHIRDAVPQGRISRLAVRFARIGKATLLANSQYVADGLLLDHGGGRARVVPNPVDTSRFDPNTVDRAHARSALGMGGDAIVLTVVGQLTPMKGQAEAVAAVGLLRETHPDIRLLIVGSAKFAHPGTQYDNVGYAQHLSELIEALDLTDVVTLCGERSDVPELLRATDILLVPSWYEGFGRVALEGMAMGVPVVATSVGGPSEVIEDDLQGVLVPPRSPDLWARAVAALIAAPERRADMGRRGRERAVAMYGVARHAQRVRAIYDELLS